VSGENCNSRTGSLTAAQRDLLDAAKAGTTVHFMGGGSCYYFRTDTMKRCTKQAQALICKGFLVEQSRDWRGAKYKFQENSKD
jgi:t-SNARE complex subunit (syntaxin)